MHSLILVVLASRNGKEKKKDGTGKSRKMNERTNEGAERERGRAKDRIPEEEARIEKAMKEQTKKSD